MHTFLLRTVHGHDVRLYILYHQTLDRVTWERALRRKLAAAPGGSKLQCSVQRCRRRTVTHWPGEKMVAEWLRHMGANHLGENI